MIRKLFMSTIIALGIFICIPVFAQTNVTPTPLTSCTTTLEEGCYTLLEPLGGIEGVSVGNANGEGGIGGFMNFIFGIGIGVAGVLGVVMLIIYGFQYASNEQSIRGFTELKEKITSVILGLLLLLGTFILLRTINPDLLLVDPEIGGVSFEFDVESDGDGGGSLGDSNLGAFVNQKSPACPEGVEVVQGIYICKSMSKNLNDLLNQAKSDGIRLGGGGFRTLQKQIEFRNKNCSCNNNTECIYKKSSSQCTPPTAIPGKSRHQSGLAIDFTCEGQSIRARDNKCFIWMKNNANKYGFFNLPSEAWHWSVDGK